MKTIGFIFTVLLLPITVLALEKNCSITGEKLELLLKQDYKSFDQTLPDGGWRGIEHHGCPLEAAKIIDVYHLHNLEDLIPWQARVLTWHAGQVYASEGLTNLALSRFKKSFDPDEKPNDGFMWNAYVNGSIAFLERNLKELISYRDMMACAEKKSEGNFKVLDAMVRCFNSPYKEVSTGKCTLGP